MTGVKKEFDDEEKARTHEQVEHDILYIPMERKDLYGLINFIVTNDRHHELLTKRLKDTLYSFVRN